MRLIRLHVQHFGPVRKADLEFGPGLNVLYGQNDLGKSYLAHSIRAALLLPHTSTAHQEFVAWGTDETPRVVLTFQTRDEVFWRVSKAFGKSVGAAATLERSPNGEQWSLEAKGRDVDGQLRRLLEWGIPEPGGKGKKLPRGLPQSFLTKVLLAEQGDTLSLFDDSLLGDPDESGKQLLSNALQALAQDPLFKEVLETSQGRVDEAYLPTGNKRRGRHDPFPRASEAIRQALEEHERRRRQLEETQRVQEQLKALIHERLVAHAARDEAAASLAKLEAAWEARRKQGEIKARVAEAEAEVVKVSRAEMEAMALAKAFEARQMELEDAAAALSKAERAAEAARERQRRAEGEEGVRQRELEREQLEKRLLELQASERNARARFETAQRAGAQVKAIAKLEKEIGQRREAVAAARAAMAGLVEKTTALEKEREQLRGVGALLRWSRAVTELEEATTARDRAAELRSQAGKLRAESEAAAAELAAAKLPTAEEVRELRDLARELEVAEARLDVGLSVRLRLERAVDLEVSGDGREPERTAEATGEHRFEAERRVRLRLAGVGEVEVAAGAPEARKQGEDLALRWHSDAVPLLQAAGARDLVALEALCRGAEDARRTAEERTGEAARLEAQAKELDELAGQVASREARVKEREATIEGYDRSALEMASKLGEDAEGVLEQQRRANDEVLKQANAKREEKKGELDRAENDLGHLEKQLAEEVRRRDEVLAAFEEPWQAVLSASEAEFKRLAEELDEARAKRSALDEGLGTVAAAGRAALEAAEKRLEEARARLASGTEARDGARVALESKRAELTVLRENAGKVDLAGLRAEFGEARAAVEAVGVGGKALTEERLAAARQAVEEREAALAEKSREVDEARGALGQVGGDVAVEREKEALDALLRAKEREQELELDYGAWRLLVETLREAENEESTHLGRALIGPVSERFSELTRGRYGEIGLDPDLRTTGVRVGGEEKAVGSLSQGLKEQLATVFRVSVAQHLESMIVLDDHLTHTDPERLGWFREVLRKCGEEIQVVVFTCRPGDYLVEGEWGAATDVFRPGERLRLRGVDLERVLLREDVGFGKPVSGARHH